MGLFRFPFAPYNPNEWTPRHHIPRSNGLSLASAKDAADQHNQPKPSAQSSSISAAGDTRHESSSATRPSPPPHPPTTPTFASEEIPVAFAEDESFSGQRGHTPAMPPSNPPRGDSDLVDQPRSSHPPPTGPPSTESDLQSHVFRMVYGYEGMKQAAAMGGLSEKEKNALGKEDD